MLLSVLLCRDDDGEGGNTGIAADDGGSCVVPDGDGVDAVRIGVGGVGNGTAVRDELAVAVVGGRSGAIGDGNAVLPVDRMLRCLRKCMCCLSCLCVSTAVLPKLSHASTW